MTDKVRQIMSLVLEVPVSQIDDSFSAATVGHWDSIKHLNLVMALEEGFDVQFSSEELGTLDSYAAIAAALRRQGIE